ncbi:MAG: hypothetical protein J6S21_00810, partial [Victivallales bacterium]|nr:hypothetical protein [Victivallales bacterium]
MLLCTQRSSINFVRAAGKIRHGLFCLGKSASQVVQGGFSVQKCTLISGDFSGVIAFQGFDFLQHGGVLSISLILGVDLLPNGIGLERKA